MSVDFGKTAFDYRKHRSGFPSEFFWSLNRCGVGLRGQRILDLGTGTGTLARGFALQGASVCAIDIALPLIEQAKHIDRENGVFIDYMQVPAEQLPYESGSFDVVTAGQCWHWFDRARAAAEAFRVLHEGGMLVISHFDWLPIKNTVVAETEKLILQYNPRWAMAGTTGMYPQWCEDLTLAGFEEIRTQSFDTKVEYTHERWRGRIRASAGVAASLPAEEVSDFDDALAKMLKMRFSEQPMQLLHRVWTLICHKPY
ncbi:hypothetical protein PRtIB026_A28960 [Pseudomonas sp. RtIB026]|uniref:class I SAM-dependent methyltransferase n=1 Tax=Pseudomonas sp. RtIB026 TaxID=2749999 RepID=UPI0022700B51|nr:class I SAM-dependent methyltransferase [Pseudomonas sp. RtIB026]BDU09830.1 hypothetical protein PRtIB026_A28960 [Pseudomonas sp. RtIB026]